MGNRKTTQFLHRKLQSHKDEELGCQGNSLAAKHTSLLRIESSHRNFLDKSLHLAGMEEAIEGELEFPTVFWLPNR